MNGFTLIETLVVISILIIVTTLVSFGWPRIRAYQALLESEQRLEGLLATARERTLNEQREAACLATVTEENERTCSNIGLALRDNTVLLFADTQASSERYTPGQDFIISTETIPAELVGSGGSWYSLVFNADPPTAVLYEEGHLLTSDDVGSLSLRAGNVTFNFTISPYGHLTRNE